MSLNLAQVALLVLIPAILSAIGAYARVLTARGAIAAFVVGAIVALAAPALFPALTLMVILGETATRVRAIADAGRESDAGYATKPAIRPRGSEASGARLRQSPRVTEFRKPQRGAGSVIGNGGVTALFAAAYAIADFTGADGGILALLFLAAAGSIASAAADTVAGEIGRAVRAKAVLVTTFKPVEPGANGGVSVAGTLAGVAAACLIAMAAAFASSIPALDSPFVFDIYLCTWLVFAGTAGSVVDSTVGATLEGKPIGLSISRRFTPCITLGNNETNILCTLAGAIVASLFGYQWTL
jgi:uncharacterized protein (TIGR00297 family)